MLPLVQLSLVHTEKINEQKKNTEKNTEKKMDKNCSLLSSEFVSEFPGFLLQMKAKYHLFDILPLSPGYLTRIPFRGEEDPPLAKVTNSMYIIVSCHYNKE